MLTTVQVDGKNLTRYETILVFWGVLAYLVKILARSGLGKASDAMAEALKKRAENAV